MTKTANALDVYRLRKSYGDTVVVDDVNLAVPEGALVTLLGPSGCGKSTLLRMIAGFVPPTAGTIRIGDRDIGPLSPERRPTAMVFQSYALFPHMSVFDNVAFGLRLRRNGKAALRDKVERALALVRMQAFAARFPRALSGGQQQRVALARCLVIEPQVLLLDEPFGALDRHLREEMQVELRKLQKLLNITMLVVTHDQNEALVLSDYVAVMNGGRIEQLAPPATVYDRPATRFVADFMGVANILDGTLVRDGDGSVFAVYDGPRICLSERDAEIPNGACHLALRPETLRLVSPDAADASFVGEVTFASLIGSVVNCEIKVQGHTLTVATPRTVPVPAIGQPAGVAIDPKHAVVLSR